MKLKKPVSVDFFLIIGRSIHKLLLTMGFFRRYRRQALTCVAFYPTETAWRRWRRGGFSSLFLMVLSMSSLLFGNNEEDLTAAAEESKIFDAVVVTSLFYVQMSSCAAVMMITPNTVGCRRRWWWCWTTTAGGSYLPTRYPCCLVHSRLSSGVEFVATLAKWLSCYYL